MSEENVQLVREGLAAMEKGDVETLIGQVHPQVEWVNPDYAVETGTRYGLEGYRRAIQATHDSFEELRFEVGEIVDLEDRVIVIGTMNARGKGSGIAVRQSFGNVFTFKDGKVFRLQWFNDAAEARAAAEALDAVREPDVAS